MHFEFNLPLLIRVKSQAPFVYTSLIDAILSYAYINLALLK